MSVRNRELDNITCSGGLLSEHFIAALREESISLPLVSPHTFRLPYSETGPDRAEYDRTVSRAWQELLERWDAYGYGRLQKMDPAEARTRWTVPLLKALGFEPVPVKQHIEISDTMKFRFSHRGWLESPGVDKPPVVHIVPPGWNLDERPEHGGPSPHDALQAYLNVHEDRWAMLTNGLYLRLLRDYHHTYTKGYIEFDLEAIFLTRSFSDFRALYRLAHASRFMRSSTGEIYLEEYFRHSQAVGEKVGADLRKNVISAITTLGNGFLDADLINELRENPSRCLDFYEEILRIVYRIIFLLYAEQRGMIGGARENDLYLEEYSLTALRERAIRYTGRDDDHTDHWLGLKNTFRLIWKGSEELGIYPYNGMLFDTSRERYTSEHPCRNSELLEAIRYLTVTEIDGTSRKISYSEIDVEEIGAIYESLLDYTPRITDRPEEIEGVQYPANTFILDPRGTARKSTGSYYTHPDLVQQLIKSALVPVMEARLNEAGSDRKARERAILSIRVCDPACGSGAFLIAACNRLALELARVRSGSDVPDGDMLSAAKRDVLKSCIYGVDLNPMAVELAKVSLWINAMVRDKPLTFLDHHIKCGNSLVGATPELIAGGVPDEAFDPVTGDDKATSRELKRINKQQKRNRTWDSMEDDRIRMLMDRFSRLMSMEEDSPGDVVDKCRAYRRLQQDDLYMAMKLQADAWTAAFFMEMVDPRSPAPTTAEVRRLAHIGTDAGPLADTVNRLAEKFRFFHWHLEFPDVFERGGFDVVIGNPPWERVKLQDKEFFVYRDPEVAAARTAAERKRMISRLRDTKPDLYNEYIRALRDSESVSKFLRGSGRFRLTGVGDVNTYAVFAELSLSLINNRGRAGLVVPSGIATDFTYSDFFSHLMDEQKLVSLYDFENRGKLFREVDSRMKFSLLTMTGGGCPTADFAFFLHSVRDLLDEERHIRLTRDDLKLLNPNTGTCPIFRNRRDAELTRKMYSAARVLVDERTGENPWGVRFLRMFDMTNDSHLFRTREQLESEGFCMVGNMFVRGDEVYLPLYEAKMFHLYDHRFADMESGGEIDGRYEDPAWLPLPRYWVSDRDVKNIIKDSSYLLGYRNITNTTNERTFIGSVLPPLGAGNSINIVFTDRNHLGVCMLSNMNTFCFDFVARQKVGGTNFSHFILKQLPVIPPDAYNHDLVRFIIPRVLELTYTSWDIKPFADDIWREADDDLRDALKRQWDDNVSETDGGHADATPPEWARIDPEGFPYPPFKWEDERRYRIKAELDAIYARLYGLTREDLDYILETFPIVKRNDIDRYGRYLTKELIMHCYDKYAASNEMGKVG